MSLIDAGRSNKDVVSDAFARWSGDEGSFLELLDNNVTWTTVDSESSAKTHGRQEYIDRMVTPIASRFSQPLRPTVRGIWADGDMVIVHWEGSASANDGVPYRNTYAWFFRMQNGRAIEVTAFFDRAAYDAVIERVAPSESQA